MIQIDFYSEDIISLLTPIYSTKPEKVYFLIDPAELTDPRIVPIKETILSWGFVRQLHFLPANRYDIRSIMDCLQEIIEAAEGDIYIDLTGGWELFSAGAYQLCQKEVVTPIYMNLEKEIIYHVDSGEILTRVHHISANDFISAVGAKRLDDSHFLPAKESYPLILTLAEKIFRHLPEWHALNHYIADRLKSLKEKHSSSRKPKTVSIPIPPAIRHQGVTYSTKYLVKQFVRYGLLLEKEGQRYRFASLTAMQYLRTFGIWLELFIYIKAQSFFDESSLGVVIDWQKSDELDTKDNEIDVLVMHRSMPIFISCKMREIKADDVYEVGYLASRLGGRQAKSIIATTFPARMEEENPTGIYRRLEKMKIGLIEASDFLQFPSDEVFERALAMTK